MLENLKENFKTPKSITLLIIGALVFFGTIIGATYAYFAVTAQNNATNTSTTGALVSKGEVALTTNTTRLHLSLDSVLMSEDNIGTKYFATTDPNGTPITTPTAGNGIYTLATVSLSEGNTSYDCTYNYDITGVLYRAINDGSDEDIKVTIKGNSISRGELTYTLKDILAGSKTISGQFKNITAGVNQTITIESTVENTAEKQDDFKSNNYSITLTPTAFSCEVAGSTPKVELATKLIEDGAMWQSGLEGDGYRFTGSGLATASTSPDNFICFGTDDASACKANEEKYLYRIIGVFEDTEGNNHVKLIKYKQLTSTYAWNADYQTDVAWENSDLYKGLNESYFATNTAYDYMQDDTWSNKITNWTWSAVNSQTYSNSGPNYYNATTEQIYLHEMNRTSKTSSIGEWTTPTAKIGLMYGSDFQMSLGASSLAYTSSSNYTTLKTGWMHQSNNDTTANSKEWTISRHGADRSFWRAWAVSSDGYVYNSDVYNAFGLRPVFYLELNTTYVSGTGDYADPIIIG